MHELHTDVGKGQQRRVCFAVEYAYKLLLFVAPALISYLALWKSYFVGTAPAEAATQAVRNVMDLAIVKNGCQRKCWTGSRR